MLQIGAFSVLSRIGIRTLRYYANFGLLVPAFVDSATNYRYYTEAQLIEANRIESLRAMGMSLSQIKQLLCEYDNADKIKAFLVLLPIGFPIMDTNLMVPCLTFTI